MKSLGYERNGRTGRADGAMASIADLAFSRQILVPRLDSGGGDQAVSPRQRAALRRKPYNFGLSRQTGGRQSGNKRGREP